jgi:hypothetical protein
MMLILFGIGQRGRPTGRAAAVALADHRACSDRAPNAEVASGCTTAEET